MKTKLLLSSITTAVLLSGCGQTSPVNSDDLNENSAPAKNSKIVSGKVIDGYIKGANVYLDMNGNGKFDTNEPYAVSDANGSYKLVGNFDLNDSLTVIAENGIDMDTNKSFNGKLKGLITEPNITPATTLVKELMDKNMSKNEAISEVAKVLKIDKKDITKDPIKELKENNDTLYKANLSLHKTMELIAADTDKNVTDIYDDMAKTIHKAKQDKEDIMGLDDIIDKSDDINETVKEKAKELHQDIKGREFKDDNRAEIAKEIQKIIPHKKAKDFMPIVGNGGIEGSQKTDDNKTEAKGKSDSKYKNNIDMKGMLDNKKYEDDNSSNQDMTKKHKYEDINDNNSSQSKESNLNAKKDLIGSKKSDDLNSSNMGKNMFGNKKYNDDNKDKPQIDSNNINENRTINKNEDKNGSKQDNMEESKSGDINDNNSSQSKESNLDAKKDLNKSNKSDDLNSSNTKQEQVNDENQIDENKANNTQNQSSDKNQTTQAKQDQMTNNNFNNQDNTTSKEENNSNNSENQNDLKNTNNQSF